MAAFASKNTFKDFIAELEKADKDICEYKGNGWKEATTIPPEWVTCGILESDIPNLKILREIGESNGKEHGKRFEENLKIVVAKALSENFLTKKEEGAILNKLQKIKKYKRKYITRPITDVFFLEETEHKNDEKDIDTNQILYPDVKWKKFHNKIENNPMNEYGVNCKWEWDFNDKKLVDIREKAKLKMGSGINIKCAQMSSEEGEGDSYIAWPNPIDCASCITFFQETFQEEKWIFAVGVWEQVGEIKCIKGVWFIEIEKDDGNMFWGCTDEKDKNERKNELYDINDKIVALKRFNKVRGSKKTKAMCQRPHLKSLYYYGDIECAKDRCKDWKAEYDKEVKEEKEKMAYSGCIPLLNKIREKLENMQALLRLTPKVQVDKAQARLQCNLSTANFKQLVATKGDKAIFSTKFNYLFRPIKKKDSKKKKGGAKKDDYNGWLAKNNAIESNDNFFFDEEGNSYGYPIFIKNKIIYDFISGNYDINNEKTHGFIENLEPTFEIPDDIDLLDDPEDEFWDEDTENNLFDEEDADIISKEDNVIGDNSHIGILDKLKEKVNNATDKINVEIKDKTQNYYEMIDRIKPRVRSRMGIRSDSIQEETRRSDSIASADGRTSRMSGRRSSSPPVIIEGIEDKKVAAAAVGFKTPPRKKQADEVAEKTGKKTGERKPKDSMDIDSLTEGVASTSITSVFPPSMTSAQQQELNEEQIHKGTWVGNRDMMEVPYISDGDDEATRREEEALRIQEEEAMKKGKMEYYMKRDTSVFYTQIIVDQFMMERNVQDVDADIFYNPQRWVFYLDLEYDEMYWDYGTEIDYADIYKKEWRMIEDTFKMLQDYGFGPGQKSTYITKKVLLILNLMLLQIKQNEYRYTSMQEGEKPPKEFYKEWFTRSEELIKIILELYSVMTFTPIADITTRIYGKKESYEGYKEAHLKKFTDVGKPKPPSSRRIVKPKSTNKKKEELVKNRRRVTVDKKVIGDRKVTEDKRREKLVYEMLELIDEPPPSKDGWVVTQHKEKVEQVMEMYEIDFEAALDIWRDMPQFYDDNRKWNNWEKGQKGGKKKKKTRRKRKKKKKKTRTKK
jgi:hypothetical protein